MFLHIDIDSFFISAERTVNKKLLNIPSAVGSRSNLEIFSKERRNIKLLNINSGAFVTPVFHSDFKKSFKSVFVDKINNKEIIRGIITTASYEARECGVKTAMPIAKALKLCPNLVVVPSNYTLYHKLSKALYIYLKSQIPKVEQYSIDEFFGQIEGWVQDNKAKDFAKNLQFDIYKKFKLPVSIGVAKSKYIAKLATEFAKPFGIYMVNNQYEFIKDIPIEKFPGIGKGFYKRLNGYGIKTLGDVCASKELLYRWKLPGIELYNKICAPNYGTIELKEPKKSIGLSRTFDAIFSYEEIYRRVMIMARHISFMVKKAKVNPTRFELKIYYNDGLKVKNGQKIDRIFSEQLFKETLAKLLKKSWHNNRGVIKLRVSASSFKKIKNPSLIDFEKDLKKQNLDKAITKLREKFGLDVLKSGNEI
jgi:DNA polymerase-4